MVTSASAALLLKTAFIQSRERTFHDQFSENVESDDNDDNRIQIMENHVRSFIYL